MFKVIIASAIIIGASFYFNKVLGFCMLAAFIAGLISWSRSRGPY